MAEEKVSYIRDVWHDNLESEMATIREMIVTYPCVSMDTEFPGVVVKPIGSFKSGSDYLYQTLRTNVDLLKIIQVCGTRSCAPDNSLSSSGAASLGGLPSSCAFTHFDRTLRSASLSPCRRASPSPRRSCGSLASPSPTMRAS